MAAIYATVLLPPSLKALKPPSDDDDDDDFIIVKVPFSVNLTSCAEILAAVASELRSQGGELGRALDFVRVDHLHLHTSLAVATSSKGAPGLSKSHVFDERPKGGDVFIVLDEAPPAAAAPTRSSAAAEASATTTTSQSGTKPAALPKFRLHVRIGDLTKTVEYTVHVAVDDVLVALRTQIEKHVNDLIASKTMPSNARVVLRGTTTDGTPVNYRRGETIFTLPANATLTFDVVGEPVNLLPPVQPKSSAGGAAVATVVAVTDDDAAAAAVVVAPREAPSGSAAAAASPSSQNLTPITLGPGAPPALVKAAAELQASKAKEYLEVANEMVSNHQYHSAAKLINKLIDATPAGEPAMLPTRLQLLHELGALFTTIKNAEKAIPVYKELVALTESGPCRDFTKAASYRVVLGRAYFDVAEYLRAAECFHAALNMVTDGKVSHSPEFVRDARTRLGASWFRAGKVDEGVGLIQQTLNGDVNYDLGVMWMCHGYVAKDHARDGLTWAMQLLVKDQQNAEKKANFASILRQVPDAVELLTNDILKQANQPEAASVWGFMATIAKDNGLVEQAGQLMEHSLRITPDHAGYWLNYIHVLEVQSRLRLAINRSLDFFKSVPSRRIQGGVSCANVAQLMQPYSGNLQKLSTEVVLTMPDLWVRVTTDFDGEVSVHPPEDAADIPPGICLQRTPEDEDSEEGRKAKAAPRRGGTPMLPAEMDLAAVLFTVVKVYFALGDLKRVCELVDLLNPLRLGRELHTTLIRNEQAYFSSIALAVQHHSPDGVARAIAANEAGRRLYYIGDSHTISLSWQSLRIPRFDAASGESAAASRGDDSTAASRTAQDDRLEDVCVVNKLVTGVKIWHLRPESEFYTKHNFETVSQTIPPGSDVMFNIGEIDCREGIIQAVQKCRYDSQEEAMETLARIYLAVIQRFCQRVKPRRLFVHLPVAYLDPTRHVVLPACAVLQKVLRNRTKVERTNTMLYVFDVNGKLLDHDHPKKRVKPEYSFDGTHCSPTYKPLVEEAMRDAVFGS